MHPYQFTLLNAQDQLIVEQSIKDLTYHAEFLDLLMLDRSAKIQIHIGGAYQNKRESISRFIARLEMLHPLIRKRLVIENDERSFTIEDCLQVNKRTVIPVLFDSFHHSILNNSESIHKTLEQCSHTWKRNDGPPMIDYSSQNSSGKRGNHAKRINQTDFKVF
jgi:UV DNA damage endonuclease